MLTCDSSGSINQFLGSGSAAQAAKPLPGQLNLFQVGKKAIETEENTDTPTQTDDKTEVIMTGEEAKEEDSSNSSVDQA